MFKVLSSAYLNIVADIKFVFNSTAYTHPDALLVLHLLIQGHTLSNLMIS